MSAQPPRPWLELAITAFCAVRADDLLAAWRHAPLDRLGWLALLIWLAPLARRESGPADPWKAWSLGAALALAVLSTLVDFNVFGHLALACALASWRRWHWTTLVWLGAAVCWMPVFGWLFRGLGAPGILALRLSLALLASIFALAPRRALHPEPA